MKSKNLLNQLIIIVALSLFVANCSSGDDTPEITAPIVSTDTIFETTQATAIIGGKITSNGGSPVTQRGLCWGIKSGPTTADDTLMFGAGDKPFTAPISGLTKDTKYFVRAFATNGIGTSYGNEMTFTTGLVSDVDGNVYKYISIGTQTWMVGNMKTATYRNGNKIPLVPANADWAKLTTGGFAFPDNSQTNLAIHGRLYNWFAAHDSRNICPKGWRLPTDAEFTKLKDELLDNTTAGNKLKEAGTTNWDTPSMGTNSSGFTAVGSGLRDMDGTFKEFKGSANFWSATPKDATTGTIHYVTKDLASFLNKAIDKKTGASCRCIKN